jgi:hypothetical protein
VPDPVFIGENIDPCVKQEVVDLTVSMPCAIWLRSDDGGESVHKSAKFVPSILREPVSDLLPTPIDTNCCRKDFSVSRLASSAAGVIRNPIFRPPLQLKAQAASRSPCSSRALPRNPPHLRAYHPQVPQGVQSRSASDPLDQCLHNQNPPCPAGGLHENAGDRGPPQGSADYIRHCSRMTRTRRKFLVRRVRVSRSRWRQSPYSRSSVHEGGPRIPLP